MPEARASVLVTRPEPGATSLTEAFRQGTDVRVFKAPLLEVVGTGTPIDAGTATALLITSPQAVSYTDHLTHLPVYAVGEASSSAARAAGLTVIAAGPGAADDSLVAMVPQGAQILHPSGEDIARDLASAFADAGIGYRRVAVYQARAVAGLPAPARSFLGTEGDRFVTLLSARTAGIFGRLARSHHLEVGAPPLHAVCASRRIADAAKVAFPFADIAVTGSTDTAGFIDFVTSRRT